MEKKEKVTFGGLISKQVVEQFRRYVFNKYGKTYGNIGRELEKAIKNYLKQKGNGKEE